MSLSEAFAMSLPNSPADHGSYIIGFILYVAYVIPRILQKFQTEGWHVVVDASCAPYWDLIQHLQSCAEKVCWGIVLWSVFPKFGGITFSGMFA